MTDPLAQMAARGATAKEIAKALGCSPTTVRRRAQKGGIAITAAPNKYGAKRVFVEGEGWFDSKAEMKRWNVNKLRQAMGEISNLRRQVPYCLEVNGVCVGIITVDIDYFEDNAHVVEDVKGGRATATQAYKLRRRLFEALYPGIEFREIRS